MNIDIHTLALASSLVAVLETTALLLHHRLQSGTKGPGWWTLATGLLALALVANYLRDNPVLGPASIVANNILFTGALLFLFFGFRAFGARGNRRLVLPAIVILAVFSAAMGFFTFGSDSFRIRGILVSLSSAALSAISVWSITGIEGPRSTALERGLASLFVFQAVFMTARAIAQFFSPAIPSPFASTPLQVATYVDILVVSLGWTFGCLALLNRRLDRGLRETNETLELFFEASPDAIVISTLEDGKFMRINRSFAAMTGWTFEEVVGRRVSDLDIWVDTAQRETMARALAATGACDGLEISLRRKDGSVFKALSSSRRIVIRGVPHILSSTHDITRRMLDEERIKESEAILAEAQRLACLASWEWSFAVHGVTWAKGIEAVFGVGEEEFRGNPSCILELVHPDDLAAFTATMEESRDAGTFPNLEYRIRRRDGSIAHIHQAGILIFDEAGRPRTSIATAQDITELKTFESRSKAQSAFLSRMSHELYTPMNAILGFAQLLERDHESPLSVDQKDGVREILAAGRRLLGLFDELIDFSSQEADPPDSCR